MSFFDWVRGVKPAVVEPAKEKKEDDGNYADDFQQMLRLAKKPSITVAQRIKSFETLMPTPKTVAAMDGSAAEAKEMYGDSQPNLSDELYLWYARQGFIGHQMAAIVAQHWLVSKACAMPARDAVRNGWKITSNGDGLTPEELLEFAVADRKFKIKKQLREFLTMGRIFGVRIALPVIDYGSVEESIEAYENPFNIDGIKPGAFKGWSQIDPYWTSPELDSEASANPASQHFYEPTHWLINGRRYHRTHLIIYRHGELADLLKPAYQYGGIPVPQLIMERVYAAERTANEAPLLALTKRTVVYKTDIAHAMENKEEFLARVQYFTHVWNNEGVRIIDSEEEHEQHDTSLGDLDALIMTQYQLVAAEAEVPATKLLGTSAKGFNATGEHDESNYHESLESIQENDLQDFLERHYLLTSKSLQIDAEIEVSWNPLDVPTAVEASQIKASDATASSALIASGALDPREERRRLATDDNSGFKGLIDDREVSEI